jgi:glutathione S-transferase
MGAGASSISYKTAEEALADGKSQEEIDAWIKANAESTPTYPNLTLVYLKMQALAEPALMMLEYAKIPYAYEYAFNYWGKSWPECKSLVPFGQVPVLIVDQDEKNMICQSGSICRYIASLRPDLFKPSDLLQCGRCDALFSTANELFAATNPVANFMKGENFTNAITKFMEPGQGWPGWLARLAQFSKQLQGPFFFGEKPMYCDFVAYHHFQTIRSLKADALDSEPSVVAFMAAFESLDGVKEYLASRPTLKGVGENPMLTFPDGQAMPTGGAPCEVSKTLSKVKSSA